LLYLTRTKPGQKVSFTFLHVNHKLGAIGLEILPLTFVHVTNKLGTIGLGIKIKSYLELSGTSLELLEASRNL
jgi:hypothetical protein